MKCPKYLACAIDTDGSIHVSKTSLRSGKGGYTFKVTFSNNSLDLVKHVKSLIGCKREIEPPQERKNKNWKLIVSDQKTILKLLTFIEEYLIVKKQKALWMIELCKSRLSRERHKEHYSEQERGLIFLIRGRD